MARLHYGRYGRRRAKRRAYLITGVIVLIACCGVYWLLTRRDSGESGNQTTPPETGDSASSAAEHDDGVMVVKPEPEKVSPSIKPAGDTTPQDNPEAAQSITEAKSLIDKSPPAIIEARDILNNVLTLPMSYEQSKTVAAMLSQLADKWLFSKRIFSQDDLCDSYTVKEGELLSQISKRYKVPYQILMEINKIPDPRALWAGSNIKVINGPFHARVFNSSFTMNLYLQNTFVKSFKVGLGKPGMETPTGVWLVEPGGKLIKPVWTDPVTQKTYHPEAPDYPLGSRWIGLKGLEGEAKGRNGFAIHGTKDPDQIGTASSQGCIRMHNGSAILIYNLLFPGYSRVEVLE